MAHQAELASDRPASIRVAAELVGTLVVLAAATVTGAALFAVAQGGVSTFQDLALDVGLPAAAVIVVILLGAGVLRWRRLATGIALGFLTGAVSTLALEAVRITGFRVLDSMPGDLPQLMGVLLTNRIMQGPDTLSTALGYTDHYWNGAMFGITYVLLFGGMPRRRRGISVAILVGVVYGLLLGTGFLASPAATSTGAGVFGTLFGPKFAITVYLAHAAFGALLAALVHRFGRRIDPLWTPVIALARRFFGRDR